MLNELAILSIACICLTLCYAFVPFRVIFMCCMRMICRQQGAILDKTLTITIDKL